MMNYDNDRNRRQYGYDGGNIIDGVVTLDPQTNEYVLVDDEGVAFSSQEVLKGLAGKQVRLTCISFESIEVIQNLLLKAQQDG